MLAQDLDKASRDQDRKPHPNPLVLWSLEISASLASTGVIIAIACILAAWNGRSIGDWESPITLNALLSVLVTLLYLWLMVDISSCLSQLKWNHYAKHTSPLNDMVLFDQASRSAWASLLLLLKRPRWYIAAYTAPLWHSLHRTNRSSSTLTGFAALLTIAVAAIGPFVQQILQSRVAPLEKAGIGSISIMNRTSTSDDRSRVNFGHIYSSDRELNEAIFSGLVATSPQDFLVKPSCSGNCTWDSIWTLAIESECQLINDQLINGTHLGPGGFTPPMLPNGFQLIRPSTQQGEDSVQFNLSGSYPTLAFLDRGYVLADFFLLYSADAYSPAQAVECVLQFAGHNVKAQTRNSVYTETSLTAPLFNNTKGARLCSPWLYYMAQNAPYNTTTDDIPLDEVTLAYLDVEACQLLLHDEAQDVTLDFSLGLLDTFPSKIAKVLTSTSGAYGADVALASLIGNYQTANLTMQDRVSNLAKSLSRAMRTSLLKGLPLATTDIRKDVVTYQVIWSWITLPASLVGLSIVLLILTIFDTRRKDVSRWTDSALALIAYGGYRAIEPAMHHGADLETWEGFARQQEVMMGERGVLIAKF